MISTTTLGFVEAEIARVVQHAPVARTEAWHRYQREAARLFEQLGFATTLDAHLEGARAEHDVDVLVEFRRAGVDHSWVVECKLWKRRIPKSAVLTLQRIVGDVGADRGILLSESGPQPGAVTATRYSNITLTNLEDLRRNAEVDLFDFRLGQLFRRYAEAEEKLRRLGLTTVGRPPLGSGLRVKPGMDWDGVLACQARLSAVQFGVTRARTGHFPAPYDLDLKTEQYLDAEDLESFLNGAEQTLSDLEPWLKEEDEKPWDPLAVSRGSGPRAAPWTDWRDE